MFFILIYMNFKSFTLVIITQVSKDNYFNMKQSPGKIQIVINTTRAKNISGLIRLFQIKQLMKFEGIKYFTKLLCLNIKNKILKKFVKLVNRF
jgi:hypothetical protein